MKKFLKGDSVEVTLKKKNQKYGKVVVGLLENFDNESITLNLSGFYPNSGSFSIMTEQYSQIAKWNPGFEKGLVN